MSEPFMSSRMSEANVGKYFPSPMRGSAVRSLSPDSRSLRARRRDDIRRLLLGAVAVAFLLAPATASAQKLYITNQGSASITVVDQQTFSVDTVIDLTKLGYTANAKPHHAIVEPDGSFWYATLIGDGRVLKFDSANHLVGEVKMETPGLLAIDPVHDSLYVGRSMTAVNPPRSLGVIKRSSFTMVEEQEIQIPRPHALVTTRDGKWVHVASLAENRFASLETATGRVTLTTLPGNVTRSMVQFAVTPDGSRLLVGGELSNTVMVFDLTRLPPFTPIAEFVVNGKPWDPVVSADSRHAYFSLFADSAVADVDLSTGKVVRTFTGGLAQPYDMILRTDGKYLFVVNQNLGAVKPGASAHDNMPGMANMPAMAPRTGWLSIINVATGKVEKTLPLGMGPTGMGAPGAR
ncbi:MAG: surface antigen [Gemmatimonadetes bacterium]|nr:surface antigen [Gemmatimonadota bacterium]